MLIECYQLQNKNILNVSKDRKTNKKCRKQKHLIQDFL